jgi:hypothetical protein
MVADLAPVEPEVNCTSAAETPLERIAMAGEAAPPVVSKPVPAHADVLAKLDAIGGAIVQLDATAPVVTV